MLARGWLDEVRSLLTAGSDDHAKPFDFIGYREMLAAARGKMELEQARSAIQQATRRYAKRQLTWFRKETGVHWLEGFGDEPSVREAARDWIRSQLGGASRRRPDAGV